MIQYYQKHNLCQIYESDQEAFFLQKKKKRVTTRQRHAKAAQ